MLKLAQAAVLGMLTIKILAQDNTLPETARMKQLEKDVGILAGQIGERNPIRYEALERARTWLVKSMGALFPRTSEQVYEVDGRSYSNIVAVKPGSDATLPSIVIGAHYDSAHGTPGADDNASAIAVLLALARHFEKTPTQHPIEFIAFTLEEPPYFRSSDMGSMRLASEWSSKQKKIKLMICLEMLGYFTDEKTQKFPLPGMSLIYPSQGNFLAAIRETDADPAVVRFVDLLKKKATLPAESLSAPRSLAGVDFSDHQSFWNHGYPALMITDTAFYRNPNYHTSRDLPDTLNYPAMAKVVESLIRAIEAYDQAE